MPKYFINAFLEVDAIEPHNMVAYDLARVGNLFDSEEDAVIVLQFLKKKINEHTKALKNGKEKH